MPQNSCLPKLMAFSRPQVHPHSILSNKLIVFDNLIPSLMIAFTPVSPCLQGSKHPLHQKAEILSKVGTSHRAIPNTTPVGQKPGPLDQIHPIAVGLGSPPSELPFASTARAQRGSAPFRLVPQRRLEISRDPTPPFCRTHGSDGSLPASLLESESRRRRECRTVSGLGIHKATQCEIRQGLHVPGA